MRRGSLVALLISLAIFCCCFSSVKTCYANEETAIEIYTLEDFLNIKNNKYGKYVLKSNTNFSSMGTCYTPFDFYGEIDGNYFSFKNLNLICENKYVGLFSNIDNAVLKNLTFDNFQIYGLDKSYCGVIAGVIQNSLIENVNIKINSYNYILGGKVGIVAGEIINSKINSLFLKVGNLIDVTNDKIASSVNNSFINLSNSEILKPDIDEKPIEPDIPSEPTEPDIPSEPIKPVEPVEPTEPVEPDKPVKPIDPTEPDVVIPEKPEIPSEPIVPGKPVNPSYPNINNSINFIKSNLFIIIILTISLILTVIISISIICIKKHYKNTGCKKQ